VNAWTGFWLTLAAPPSPVPTPPGGGAVPQFAGVLDWTAHFLYCPTMGGRRHARARWHHRVHLIPGRVLRRACDRYDRELGVADDEMTRT
jgi:hypothetical protein